MPKETLNQSVIELKSHLDQPAGTVDKEALAELVARLEQMNAAEHWEEGLVNELEKKVIQYEEDHPVLAKVFNQIINTLNSMGV